MIRFVLRSLAWTALLILAVGGGIAVLASGITGSSGVNVATLAGGIAALAASYGVYWWLKRDETPPATPATPLMDGKLPPAVIVADAMSRRVVARSLVVIPMLAAAMIYVVLLTAILFAGIGISAVFGLHADDGGIGQIVAIVIFAVAFLAPAALIAAGYRRSIRFLRERLPGLADFVGIGRED